MVVEDAESKELPHTIKLLDLGKRYNVHLAEEKLTTVSEETGTWCWHVHVATRAVKSSCILYEWGGEGMRFSLIGISWRENVTTKFQIISSITSNTKILSPL